MQIVFDFFFFFYSGFCAAGKENDALKIYMLQISEKHCQTCHERERKKYLKEKRTHGKVDNHVMRDGIM